MNRRWLLVLALIAALVPGLYGQGKGKGKGQGAAQSQGKGKDWDADKGKGKDKDKDKGKGREEQWESRGGFEYRTYEGSGNRPPGWNHGKKTGWGDCGLPPGQAKKQGACRTYTHEGRHYYYYYDEHGRMVVRRR